MEINHHVLQALKARNMMKRDVDYIVRDGEVIIIDEFTGRMMFGRRYSDGLHQAIEAKEQDVYKRQIHTAVMHVTAAEHSAARILQR